MARAATLSEDGGGGKGGGGEGCEANRSDEGGDGEGDEGEGGEGGSGEGRGSGDGATRGVWQRCHSPRFETVDAYTPPSHARSAAHLGARERSSSDRETPEGGATRTGRAGGGLP